MDKQLPSTATGPIAWMVHNRVTANLLMLVLLLGGLFMTTQIKQEVFPSFTLDYINISVAYPGSGPEEVERGIVLAVEEAIQNVDGIAEITSRAAESSGVISAELEAEADRQEVYQDIKQEVDRITTFPDDAEEPVVSLVSRRRQVLSVALFGDIPEWSLRETAEVVRDRLLENDNIAHVELRGDRDFEIKVNISQDNLRRYDLTLSKVANIIANSAVELPGGSIETSGGDILLRFRDQRDWAAEFASLPLIQTAQGGSLSIEDIATISEGFEDSNVISSYNGKRAIGLDVYRIGDQTPIQVSNAVKAEMTTMEANLTHGVTWKINKDRSDYYRQRLELLLKNAFMGLGLVLVLLGVFLEMRLAFWVTMGIPVSFLGGLLFLPGADISINMISMFAFIVALGIVVDDAIVAGENIYEYRQSGMSQVDAAIQGAKDVAVPISFSILTNIVAFMPLMFVPGVMGKIWRVIPVVVVTVFIISWVESLFILPAHLAHTSSSPTTSFGGRLRHYQQRFSQSFSRFVKNVYGPALNLCLRWRVITLAIGVAVLILVLSYVGSGRIGMILMPRVESDRAVVTAELPIGSPEAKAVMVRDQLVKAIYAVAQNNGEDDLLDAVFASIAENEIEITAYLTAPDIRPLSTGEVTKLWRQATGNLIGLQKLRFESDRGGPGGGAGLTLELSHRDTEVLDRASQQLASQLAEIPNVKDIDDGYTPGKKQLDFHINQMGLNLGLTSADIARQVRNSFYGVSAQKQQRQGNEVTVRVRLPEEERQSVDDVENLMIKTSAGTWVALQEVADIVSGHAYTTISRRNGKRTVSVTANVTPISQTTQVKNLLDSGMLEQLEQDFPGLSTGYEGRQADLKNSTESLYRGFGLAMLMIYVLLAIPFRSYTQPLIVMISIPFGIVGAVIGHIIMGYSISLMSMMGIVALSGVVVNDSLVLIDYANRKHHEGYNPLAAIRLAGERRFRPILLTTLTTFGGLAPMILETSRQARFLIPMALSLGFGILFATVIILVIVPCLYMILEDIKLMLSGTPKG